MMVSVKWLKKLLPLSSNVDTQRLVDALESSMLMHSKAAADMLRQGAVPSRLGKVSDSVGHIRHIYSFRAKGLRTRSSSPHAVQLVKCTEEFVGKIDVTQPKSLMTIEIPHTTRGSYLLWLEQDTYKPVGCLFTISQLEVSRDEWRKVWGHEAADWDEHYPDLK